MRLRGVKARKTAAFESKHHVRLRFGTKADHKRHVINFDSSFNKTQTVGKLRLNMQKRLRRNKYIPRENLMTHGINLLRRKKHKSFVEDAKLVEFHVTQHAPL